MTKKTNLSKATDIVGVQVEKRTPKKEIIQMLVDELQVSRANAFVYFTKASKALGISIKQDRSTVVRSTKAKNPVTETSPAKAAVKVAEVDAVIAKLKASGATVASPFAGLSA